MNSRERSFITHIWEFYRIHGRYDLPWRVTDDPYHILVSEVMLQQTQVLRVIKKYKSFIKKFPTVSDLAHASLHEVLLQWQGLGYNRRARMLHQAAQYIEITCQSVFPRSVSTLMELPGVGPYTARAIAIFAYNQPEVCIETNIRTVYIHEFFSCQEVITDAEIMPYIERTLDVRNPRKWYAALMDYGAYLKTTGINPSRRSAHYTIQKPFKGSVRETRGNIIRILLQKPRTQAYLAHHASGTPQQIIQALHRLCAEKIIEQQKRLWCVVT